MTIGIYKLVDKISKDTLWIGQSINIERRYRHHLNNLRNGTHSQKQFSDWYKESARTASDILVEILVICDPPQLNDLEGFWFEQDMPRFYGQIPSITRKWSLSKETRAKMSKTHSEKAQLAKKNGTYISTWDSMDELSKKLKAVRNREVGFNSMTAAIAGSKGLGKNKSIEHRRKIRQAVIKSTKIILICSMCHRKCKGKSALGSHMRTHKTIC